MLIEMQDTEKSKPLVAQNRLVSSLVQAKVKSSQGKYDCNCEKNHNVKKHCPFSNRCLGPLAWRLEHEFISTQSKSPFYTIIPKELRDMIWEYALTDCTSYNPFDCPSHAAVNLLRTCRAVYLETWALPRTLYPCKFRNTTPTHLFEEFFLPWEFACISKLEINVQQAVLEGFELKSHFLDHDKWCLHERHKGAYVGPRFLYTKRKRHALNELPRTFHWVLLPADAAEGNITHKSYVDVLRASPSLLSANFPWWTKMQVMKAQPITHLTLHLGRDDWWTWTDDPNSTGSNNVLALDPVCGNGDGDNEDRPTSDRMKWLADERRAGRHPMIGSHPDTWLSMIGQFLDLKCLELVLETFGEKKHQLEVVVECAKTWKFPITDTQFELVWDNRVEALSWGKISEMVEDEYSGRWHNDSTAHEVRIVRFTRKRAA